MWQPSWFFSFFCKFTVWILISMLHIYLLVIFHIKSLDFTSLIQNTNKANGCTSFFTWYFRLLDVFSIDKCLFLKHNIIKTSLQIFWLIFMDKSWETTFRKKSYTIAQNNQDKPQHTIKCPKKSYKKLQTRLTFKIQGNGFLTWENSKNLNCHMILSSFELHCFALALKFTRFCFF